MAADEKNQDCRFWTCGQCVKGGKCPQNHDPSNGRPHKSKDINSEMPKGMKGIMTRLAQLEAVSQTNIFSGPSASVERTTSRDILSIPDRTKRATEGADVTSYVQMGSGVRSGAARTEFTGIVIDGGKLVKLGERDSVQDGERDLVQHGERDPEKAPCMESSVDNIQQRQYDRNFEYEYQNRENVITFTNDNTGSSEIQREEQGIKLALAQVVTSRDYFEVAVGSVQDSDLEVFDYMLRYQEEICEVVPETFHMFQSDNTFDDVELQDPISSEDIQIELGCRDVDLEYQDVHDWTNETNSPRDVQKHDITDGVDLPLTTILEMFPETVEPI